MDADTGMVIERDYKLMRFGHSEADKRLQRSQKVSCKQNLYTQLFKSI